MSKNIYLIIIISNCIFLKVTIGSDKLFLYVLKRVYYNIAELKLGYFITDPLNFLTVKLDILKLLALSNFERCIFIKIYID
jgi:hypothetical protein